MIEPSDVEDARERDGARGDVPEPALELLDQEEELVGYENGLPLLAEEYSSYPEDVLSPEAATFLAEGAEAFANVEDLAEELGVGEDRVRRALDLHNIEEPTEGSSFDLDTDPDVIEIPPIGDVPLDHIRTPVYRDDRILTNLYAGMEFSIEDIAELLEIQMNTGREGSRWSVSEREVRQELVAIGLVEPSEDEGPTDFEGPNARGRLGGSSIQFSDQPSPGESNAGVNIDAEAIEEADGIELS